MNPRFCDIDSKKIRKDTGRVHNLFTKSRSACLINTSKSRAEVLLIIFRIIIVCSIRIIEICVKFIK